MPMIGEPPDDVPRGWQMDYDWTGVRTRRLLIFKRTSLAILLASLPLTLLLWLQLPD
jgi:hypothetical protein